MPLNAPTCLRCLNRNPIAFASAAPNRQICPALVALSLKRHIRIQLPSPLAVLFHPPSSSANSFNMFTWPVCTNTSGSQWESASLFASAGGLETSLWASVKHPLSPSGSAAERQNKMLVEEEASLGKHSLCLLAIRESADGLGCTGCPYPSPSGSFWNLLAAGWYPNHVTSCGKGFLGGGGTAGTETVAVSQFRVCILQRITSQRSTNAGPI